MIVPHVYRFTTNQPYFPSLSPSCLCFHLSLSLCPSSGLVFRFVSFGLTRRTKRGIGCVNFYGLTFHRRRIKNVSSPALARLERRVAAEISCPSLILVPLCRSSDGEIPFFPFPSLFSFFRVHAIERRYFLIGEREREREGGRKEDALCNVEFDTRFRKYMGYERARLIVSIGIFKQT